MQIKTGNIIDDIEEYCIIDFLLVKKEINAITGIEKLNFNNSIALETKLNLGTDLSKAQKGALENIKTNKNDFTVRSKSQNGEFENVRNVIGSKTSNKQVVINDYIKVWSDGSGKSVSDIKSLK